MGYRLISPPALEPLTLEEIKGDLRISHADEDPVLIRHMAAARAWLEERLETKLITQTWLYTFDAFPEEEIALPFGPVQSITSILYDDVSGIEQTISPGDYYLDSESRDVIPRAWVFATDAWPSTLDAVNAVRLTFVAGYATQAAIPPSIKAAFSLLVRQYYDGNDTSAQVESLVWPLTPLVA